MPIAKRLSSMKCIRNAQARTGLNCCGPGTSNVPPTEHFGYNPLYYHRLNAPSNLMANKRQKKSFLAMTIRTYRVTCIDPPGVEHTIALVGGFRHSHRCCQAEPGEGLDAASCNCSNSSSRL